LGTVCFVFWLLGICIIVIVKRSFPLQNQVEERLFVIDDVNKTGDVFKRVVTHLHKLSLNNNKKPIV